MIVGIIIDVQYHVINIKKSLPFLSIIMGIIVDVLTTLLLKKICIFPWFK